MSLVGVSLRHLGHGALAELDGVAVARVDLDQPLVRVEIPQQLGDAAEDRDRRIARVDAQADALLLGDGRDDLDPVFKVRPHLLFGVDAVMGERHRLGVLIIERRRHEPGPNPLRRRPPDVRGHPVVAKDRNAGPRHVADRVDHVLDLLVTARTVEHDVVVERRGTFSMALELQPELSTRTRSLTRS